MIDTLVYGALTATNLEPYLKGDDDKWRVWPGGALGTNGIPAQPDYPFVQYREGGSNRVMVTKDTRRTKAAYYDVWVYDEPGSMLRIKTILDIIADNLEGIVSQVTLAGWRVTEFINTNEGEDGYDPVSIQGSKRATYRAVVSRATR